MNDVCIKCNSHRIMRVSGKVSDRCWMEAMETMVEYDGYVPTGIGIGGNDYLEFDYCLNCGQIQDEKFPFLLPEEFYEDYSSHPRYG